MQGRLGDAVLEWTSPETISLPKPAFTYGDPTVGLSVSDCGRRYTVTLLPELHVTKAPPQPVLSTPKGMNSPFVRYHSDKFHLVGYICKALSYSGPDPWTFIPDGSVLERLSGFVWQWWSLSAG